MRKAIIAAIVATALFAVGAFAASFTLGAENVASQSADVTACAAKAAVNFDTSTEIHGTLNDFTVTTVTVTFTTEDDVEVTTCHGAKADLALNVGTTSVPAWLNFQDVEVVDETATFNISAQNVTVEPVVGVSVLVDGAEIATSATSATPEA